MRVYRDMAILDITVRDYDGRVRGTKTRLYIDMYDLPWDPATEEFWDDDDEAWNWWKDEIKKYICGSDIVKIEFCIIQSWCDDKMDTFFVKEF